MEKSLGKDITNVTQRIQFLIDNCDTVEEKDYMKQFTQDELQGKKESLANLSIKIADLEQQAKESAAYYKGELKPLKEQRTSLVDNIKSKAKLVTEKCYKFIDRDEHMTGYYNSDGDLIESRPSTADELQPVLFPGRMQVSKENNDGNMDAAVNQ